MFELGNNAVRDEAKRTLRGDLERKMFDSTMFKDWTGEFNTMSYSFSV